MSVDPGTTGSPSAPKKSNTGAIIFLVLVVLGFAVVGFLAWKQGHSDPDTAKAGDCVARSGADDVKVVKCTDAKAAYKVVGKVDGKTQVEASVSGASICKPFAGAKSVYWKGESGKQGYVLCLAPTK